MKKILMTFMVFSMTVYAESTQQGRDPNLAQKSSGGQSLPVVGLCDYVHPCAGQAAPVALRDNANGKGKATPTSPSKTTTTVNAQ